MRRVYTGPRKHQKAWDRAALKNLKSELKTIEDLKSSSDRFVNLQRGGVVKLDTFHVIMAVQIIRGAIPTMLKEVKLLIKERRKLLK